jgi:hypothetical protein
VQEKKRAQLSRAGAGEAREQEIRGSEGGARPVPRRRRGVGRAAFGSAWRVRERASRGELGRRPASK